LALPEFSEAVYVAPDDVTRPDQLDARARLELNPLHGEKIVRCWRVPFGFLVMTNLRIVHLWHKPILFARTDWHAGPVYFFYNLATPEIVGHRFVQLSQLNDDGMGTSRFLVPDALQVGREIDEARIAGRQEWESRRARAQRTIGRLQAPAAAPGTTVIVREVIRVRCSFCGNLMDEGMNRCPSCGAPQR
jgi:hypothetical protein